jgi:pyruvate/2-oxoglutarate dehydrogenase complex dihydrolipoamide acyltransferase (E2) component
MGERVFTLPDLGEGLEEGEIVSWLVSEGDAVELNQPLVEVETAKATVEIPSPFAGTVAKLHADAGEAVPVGAPLVTFSVAGGGGEDGGATGTDSVAAAPAVRKLAKDLGVDLAALTGSGPGGRITSEDVRGAAVTEPRPAPGSDVERIELSPVRRTIGKRLEQAAAVPHVTTFRTVDCSHLEAFRQELDTSPLPVLVAALCRTIDAHPLLNAGWTSEAILVHRAIHVGVAVDTDRGLLVPVLRDAGRLGIAEIASSVRTLAEAARANVLKPDDLAGATISVSNTGSYGSEAGTPLLNPPNAVTIALGVIRPRALVVEGGAVEARPACTLSLTFDHRVLDGAAAGRALTDLVDRLQDEAVLRDLPR